MPLNNAHFVHADLGYCVNLKPLYAREQKTTTNTALFNMFSKDLFLVFFFSKFQTFFKTNTRISIRLCMIFCPFEKSTNVSLCEMMQTKLPATSTESKIKFFCKLNAIVHRNSFKMA